MPAPAAVPGRGLREGLLGPRPRDVLELGAGTGDVTIGLAALGEHLVAVEPSRPMLGFTGSTGTPFCPGSREA